jgi:hypothetical protein
MRGEELRPRRAQPGASAELDLRRATGVDTPCDRGALTGPAPRTVPSICWAHGKIVVDLTGHVTSGLDARPLQVVAEA